VKNFFRIIFLLILSTTISNAQLILNEVSQGPAGSQEYVELLVIGNPTCASSTVDLRGWVIDDNNSWHAVGSGTGIAFGHKRFSNAAQWANVRMGALIVIYNESDPNPALPADDETDSNNDCVYILPSSSSLLDHNTTMPTGSLTFTTYAAAPYTSSGNWSTLSMNNSNDAFHTVNPLAINGPYHAIGWGNNLDSNDVYFAGGMSNRVVRFTNAIDNNPFNAANFSKDSLWPGSPLETPGLANTLANATYINFMKNSCLPFSSVNITKDTSICNGSAIFAGGGIQISAGTYYDTISGAGCDTIKRTNLSIIPTSTMSQTITICFGETVIIAGTPRSTPALYRDTLVSSLGCDSILNTTLRVDTIKTSSRNISICNGQSFFAGGANRFINGTYYDSLTATSGCDSVLTTILTVNPNLSGTINRSVCAGDCILFGGILRCSNGSYFDTLTTISGCDSTVRLNLIVNSISTFTQNSTICTGENIRIGTSTYNSSGTFYDTLTNSVGCDSIVTLNLIVRPISTKTIDTVLCQGTSIRVGTSIYNTSGTFYDTLSNFLLCDSIVRSNIVVVNATFTRSISICNGDSILLGGIYRNTSGAYYDTLVGLAGCDSVLRTNLIVSPNQNTIVNQDLCIGEAYLGNFYSRDTSWTTIGTNRFGCDSTHTVNITVKPTPTITLSADTCITVGESITLTASGGFDYFWSNGTNSSSITVSPTSTTTYFVRGINPELCSGYDTITICVNEYNDSSYLAIPNAFSPNGDGLNDIFKILVTTNLDLENMQIFNRWGELVFENKNIARGWDGSFKEMQQPLGSYVYYIQVRNIVNNNIENYTGTVTLIR
jgi:gliding motility-associated-like protein